MNSCFINLLTLFIFLFCKINFNNLRTLLLLFLSLSKYDESFIYDRNLINSQKNWSLCPRIKIEEFIQSSYVLTSSLFL